MSSNVSVCTSLGVLDRRGFGSMAFRPSKTWAAPEHHQVFEVAERCSESDGAGLFRRLSRYVPIGCIIASSRRWSGTSYVFRYVPGQPTT